MKTPRWTSSKRFGRPLKDEPTSSAGYKRLAEHRTSRWRVVGDRLPGLRRGGQPADLGSWSGPAPMRCRGFPADRSWTGRIGVPRAGGFRYGRVFSCGVLYGITRLRRWRMIRQRAAARFVRRPSSRAVSPRPFLRCPAGYSPDQRPDTRGCWRRGMPRVCGHRERGECGVGRCRRARLDGPACRWITACIRPRWRCTCAQSLR